VKLLIEDIALFTQHRHLIGSLKYASRGEDIHCYYIDVVNNGNKNMLTIVKFLPYLQCE